MEKHYHVAMSISFKVSSEKSAEQLKKKIQALVDNGTIKDAFSDAEIDVACFCVDKVMDTPCKHKHQCLNDRQQFTCLDCGEELGR